jgi:hypothetical protein
VKYFDPRDVDRPGEALWKEKRREDRIRALDVRIVRIVNDDLGPPWPQMVARLRGLLATRPTGPRRFRLVRRPEPGSDAVAA